MLKFEDYLEKIGEVGVVEEVIYSIAYVNGLPNLKPNEIVVFEKGELGLTLSLSKDKAEILILSHSKIKAGEKVARTNSPLTINISEEFMGNVIDPLGKSFDGKKFMEGVNRNLDITPPSLAARAIIKYPIETGVPLVDLIVPIGTGQRQLIIGDRKTGKTHFFIKTIVNQVKAGNICIYASIGKKIVEIKDILETLKKHGVHKNVIVVASSASEAPGLIFLTPYTAMTIAEYYKDQGKNVLVILDDLTNHALYYRQISLLAGRFPGRNSYPGDIFYIHSKILERAGNFKKGSITCFPVAESVMGDLSG